MIGNERIPRWSPIVRVTASTPVRRKSKAPMLPWWATVDGARTTDGENEH
jgi:hypothetical protein